MPTPGPASDVTPLVSVVVPAYNAGPFIETAIRSVLAQTHPGIELVLVDDGSDDDTLAVMRRYEDRAVVLTHGRNRGGNAARNTGVAASRGSLVAFLDADDHWHPEKVAAFVQAFERHPEPRFAFSDFSRFEWDTGLHYAHSNSQLHPEIYDVIRDMRFRDRPVFVLPRGETFRLLLSGYPPYSSAIVVRRDIFETVGPWNESLSRNQDFEFSLRCCRATDFLYLDERLTRIGRHDSNLSTDIDAQREGDIAVMEALLDDPSYTREERRLIAHFVGQRLARRGEALRRRGRMGAACRRYARALRHPGMFVHAGVRLGYTALLALGSVLVRSRGGG